MEDIVKDMSGHFHHILAFNWILHDSHPLVVAAATAAAAAGQPGRPFILAPERTSTPSSLNIGKDPCFEQFRGFLGEAFSL